MLIGSQLRLQDMVTSGSAMHYTDHILERNPCVKINHKEVKASNIMLIFFIQKSKKESNGPLLYTSNSD